MSIRPFKLKHLSLLSGHVSNLNGFSKIVRNYELLNDTILTKIKTFKKINEHTKFRSIFSELF